MNYLCRNPILVWRQYRKIHIEKEDVTVISVKDIHKKNYLCLLQLQRSRRLTAATVGFNSPLFAAVNTTINPNNIIFHINVLNIYIYIYIYIYI